MANYNDLKRNIEENYNIEVLDIIKVKSSYRVETKNKNYCLKVIKYNFSHFLFIIGAIKHLVNKQCEGIINIIPTVTGRDYIRVDVYYAYLTDWLNTRECNYDNPLDTYLAVNALSKLHAKSYGFELNSNMKPRIGWFKWIENYRTRSDEIVNFGQRIIEKDTKTAFDSMYLEAMEEELLRAEASIENLICSEYILKMEEEIQLKGFCHHDYAHHNVLIGENQKVFVIDFDYCILDSHLHDLSSLLIRVMKNGKWELRTTKDLLNIYNNTSNLQEKDTAIMAAFMEFPQAYWQLGIQYYWERQPWEEEIYIKRLEKILEDRQEKQEFIEDFRLFKV
ncbi:MAG TPA: CotS family spore coat protein [Clostridiaceae bacterium]